MQDAHAHFLVANLLHGLNDRLGRALDVRFHQDGQFRNIFIRLGVRHQLFKRRGSTGRRAFVLGGLFAVSRDFTRLCFGLRYVQHVTRFGRAVETQNFHRDGRSGRLYPIALVVDERTHLTVLLPHNEDIALMQCAVLNQNGRNRSAANVELRFDHRTLRCTVWVRLELKNFRLKGDGLKQIIKALTCDGRNFDVLHFTGHFLNDHFVLQQIRAHLVWVSSGSVDLVDRDDHRHFGSFRVIDRLDRLRHDRVVGSDDQHHDIGHLRTARPHGRESRVARRIEEGQQLATIGFDLIGTDVLRDAPGFAGNDLGVTDRVEKRRFTMVNMAHDGHDGRTLLEVRFVVLLADRAHWHDSGREVEQVPGGVGEGGRDDLTL